MRPGASQQPTMIEKPSQAPAVNNSGRLKYANPRDLPSYPSSGLRPDGAAAGAAASLGWSNQKSIEPWTPNKSSSASAAAVLAKNYRMTPTWEPTSSSAGAKAALLAASSTVSTNKPSSPKAPQDAWGNSAATQAFNAHRSISVRQASPEDNSSVARGERSLAAAKGAMLVSRPRAISSPSSPAVKEPYPLESTAASNALSGATLAHRASMKSKPLTPDAGAVSVTTMTRSMFTSNPPVKPEVDEQQNNEKIHASAVAMARKMYAQQQKMLDQAKEAHGVDASGSQSKPYVNLQDAAYKQAQERLARLQDEHLKGREFKDYYGNSAPVPRRRFSIGSKLRRRSSSDSDLDDHHQSEKIRQQMSLFSSQLSQVDEKKRQQDRDALMAAAQRNVKARLQGMDQKIYNETGKIHPTMMSEWEIKAHQAAQLSHKSHTENKGKVDIGGGRFMSPSEVDLIASKRVQPVLDDINEMAAAERERLATLKMEDEARKAEQERQKARDREVKELNKKLKEQEKQEEKARRDEEKAARAELKRQAKEDKRRSRSNSAAVNEQQEQPVGDEEERDSELREAQDTSQNQTATVIDTDRSNVDNEHRRAPEGGSSPTSKVKGWIKHRFSRGKSVGEHDKRRSFLGGAALRDSEANRSTASLDHRPTSMRDVAIAGKATSERAETNDREALQDSRGVSPVSSPEDDHRTGRAWGNEDFAITPPRPIEDPVARTSSSPTRDSRFREMMDQ